MWIAFLVSATIVLVVPGPTILLVISLALTHGRRATIPLTAGVALGDLTAMSVSLSGLGAVLAASAMMFAALKYVGAAYLIYLGIKLWKVTPEQQETGHLAENDSFKALFKASFIVTALNPKSISFFVVFFPQFVVPTQRPIPQLIAMGAAFLVLASINAALYSLFAGKFRDMMKSSLFFVWLNRTGGTALIAAGVFTAVLQRA